MKTCKELIGWVIDLYRLFKAIRYAKRAEAKRKAAEKRFLEALNR